MKYTRALTISRLMQMWKYETWKFSSFPCIAKYFKNSKYSTNKETFFIKKKMNKYVTHCAFCPVRICFYVYELPLCTGTINKQNHGTKMG